jgi:hypothetical protein
MCELRRRLLPAEHVLDVVRHVQSWDVLGIWDVIMLELRCGHVLGADWGDDLLELLGGQLSERDGLDKLLELSHRHLCIDVSRDVLSKLRCDDVFFVLVVVVHELLVEHVLLYDRLDIVRELRDERRLRDRLHRNGIQRHRSVELEIRWNDGVYSVW